MLLVVLLLLAAQAATPAPVTAIPVDAIARAKFPNEQPEFVDELAELNRLVNGAILYQSDKDHYGIEDHWVSMPADSKGDCEDYALSKIEMLSNIGFPIVSNARIRMVSGSDHGKPYGHAILEVRMPHGSIAELDLYSELMTRAELEQKHGYKFYDW